MKLLLVTMGGAIDTTIAALPDAVPAENHDGKPISQALYTLYAIAQNNRHNEGIYHRPLGELGVKTVSGSQFKDLASVIHHHQDDYSRIIVTLPSACALDAPYHLSAYLKTLRTPVFFTGAEAPDPRMLAENAATNLHLAYSANRYCPPNFFVAEGDECSSPTAERTIYKPRRGYRGRFRC